MKSKTDCFTFHRPYVIVGARVRLYVVKVWELAARYLGLDGVSEVMINDLSAI